MPAEAQAVPYEFRPLLPGDGQQYALPMQRFLAATWREVYIEGLGLDMVLFARPDDPDWVAAYADRLDSSNPRLENLDDAAYFLALNSSREEGRKLVL